MCKGCEKRNREVDTAFAKANQDLNKPCSDCKKAQDDKNDNGTNEG